jgi:hypothetical protein
MTTGCTCPTCGGISTHPGEPCRGCGISAAPPGIGKTVSALTCRVLYGGEPGITLARAPGPEAGS